MYAYDTNRSRRKYKRKFNFKKLILKSFFIIILFSALTGLFYLPKFRIRNIAIEGDSPQKNEIEEKIRKNLRQKFLLILPADNFFLFRKNYNASQILKDIPPIKSVNFNRKFPDSLSANFEKRKKVGLWCHAVSSEMLSPNLCYFIDEEGIVFEKALQSESSTPPIVFQKAGFSVEEVSLGNSVIKKELLQSFLKFLKNAESALQLKGQKITLEKDIYKIYFEDAWFAFLDAETDFEKAFENLKIILTSDISSKSNFEYIDLRFANKVFLKNLKKN